MKSSIHVETPDGELLKATTGAGTEGTGQKDPVDTNDANDNASGPKANPDPRANANLTEKDKQGNDEGTGTEITDGESG
jgi:hypothetical protein